MPVKLDAIRSEIRANYLPDETEALSRLVDIASLSEADRAARAAEAPLPGDLGASPSPRSPPDAG